ncbi:MAG TPA: putative zinc-binding metallopeptidase [Prosthecobacter sp.]|nr:putative zinc-binding metallopeptidase [Prosthecobacter sp.]
MKTFSCACGAPLFFDNTWCLNCNSPVGYDAVGNHMLRLTDATSQLCANGKNHGVCNWVIPNHNIGLCMACQLNRTIPDLSLAENLPLWRKMENAKRRTIYWLLRRGLPVQSKVVAPETGLAVDFLLPQNGQPFLTGHDHGVLTFNLLEADDSHREGNRNKLGEPYRTLLGHFRHEIAHYYWWLWFDKGGAPATWIRAVREVFGDDRRDYVTALQTHYQNGPPAGWNGGYISAYATTHPWEDWAETWAHYTHITDALETAKSTQLLCQSKGTPWRLRPQDVQLPAPFEKETGRNFLEIIYNWMAMAPALNEMSLSLGHADLYPFSPTPAVVRKMHLIHAMVGSQLVRPNK